MIIRRAISYSCPAMPLCCFMAILSLSAIRKQRSDRVGNCLELVQYRVTSLGQHLFREKHFAVLAVTTVLAVTAVFSSRAIFAVLAILPILPIVAFFDWPASHCSFSLRRQRILRRRVLALAAGIGFGLSCPQSHSPSHHPHRPPLHLVLHPQRPCHPSVASPSHHP
jgi:O-antigen ligase